MSAANGGTRRQAAVTGALLLVAGAGMGILADRLWLSPTEARAAPLTVEALSDRLGLAAPEEARLRALLDSLHVEIAGVVERRPDALGATVQDAHRRIEAALPAEARAEFRAWIEEHHERMMGRMHHGGHGHE